MSRPAPRIELTPAQAAELSALVRAATTPQRLVLRARIVLQAAEGHPSDVIAVELAQLPTLWASGAAVLPPKGWPD